MQPQQQGLQSLLPDFFGRIEGRHFGGWRRLLEQVGKAIDQSRCVGQALQAQRQLAADILRTIGLLEPKATRQ